MSKRPHGLKDGEICPTCGTKDCVEFNDNISISGPGIIKTTSKNILKTCMARKILRRVRK